MTWLAGLFYEHMDNGFDFFSRIEDYEDTHGLPAFGSRDYGVEPGTTDNSFYHSKNDQVTEQIAVFGEVGYSPNDTGPSPAGCAGSTTRASASTSRSSRTAAMSSGPFNEGENSTSDITKKLSVQYKINGERDGVCALLGRVPGGRPERHAARSRAAGRLRSGFPRQLRTRLQEPLGRRAVHVQSHGVQDEVEGLPGRSRRPGHPGTARAVRRHGHQRRRRRDRGCQPRLHRLPLGLARLRPESPAARPEGDGGQRARRNRSRRPATLLGEGKRRRSGSQYTYPQGARWRSPVRPLPVDLHRQLAERHPDPTRMCSRPTRSPTSRSASKRTTGRSTPTWTTSSTSARSSIDQDERRRPARSRSTTRAPGASASRRAGAATDDDPPSRAEVEARARRAHAQAGPLRPRDHRRDPRCGRSSATSASCTRKCPSSSRRSSGARATSSTCTARPSAGCSTRPASRRSA